MGSLIKRFIYINLKDVIMLLQKIVCFIGVGAIAHEILRIEILKEYRFGKKIKFINFKR